MKDKNFEISKISSLLLICPQTITQAEAISAISLLFQLKKDIQITLLFSKNVNILDYQRICQQYPQIHIIQSNRKVLLKLILFTYYDASMVLSLTSSYDILLQKGLAACLLIRTRIKKLVFLDLSKGILSFFSIPYSLFFILVYIPKPLSFLFHCLFFLIWIIYLVCNVFILHLREIFKTSLPSHVSSHFEFVFFSMLDWGEITQRPHHFMKLLHQQGHRILSIGSFIPFTSNEFLYTPWIKKWNLFQPISGIYSWRPIVLPYKKPTLFFSYLHKLNKAIILLQLSFFIKKIKFYNPILYLTGPGWNSIEEYISHRILCYDYFDDYAAFPHFASYPTQQIIDHLIKKSNIVFASAKKLFSTANHLNPHTIFLNNGVDAFFLKMNIHTPIPFDMRTVPHPIIGYHGSIASWLDYELLQSLFLRYPSYSFVFIGPVDYTDINIKKIVHYQNVFFLGKRNYRQLPAYIKTFDIGIIPFKINNLTCGVDPIKLYEFFALGKSVVSVAIPEVKQYRDLLYIADTHEKFIESIQTALDEKNPLKQEKRKYVAYQNQWDKKINLLLESILSISQTERPLL